MLSPWYITGFCDGEACFTYSRTGTRGCLNLYFCIRLRDDNRYIVERIRNFFGVGKIYAVKPRPPGPHNGFTKASVFYRVHRVPELARIVQHFDKYPLSSKKAMAYQIWKEMFMLKRKFRNPDFAKLEELASKLSESNSRNTALRRRKKKK